jgi:hypothetical protein
MDFDEADRKYDELYAQLEAGEITPDAFEVRLGRIRVCDQHNRWWGKFPPDGDWRYYDGRRWVQGAPGQSLHVRGEQVGAGTAHIYQETVAQEPQVSLSDTGRWIPAPPVRTGPYYTPVLAPRGAEYSGYANAARVLGFVSLILVCVGGLCSMPVPIVGLVLGGMGLQSPERNKAVTGMVMCGLSLALAVGLFLLALFANLNVPTYRLPS